MPRVSSSGLVPSWINKVRVKRVVREGSRRRSWGGEWLSASVSPLLFVATFALIRGGARSERDVSLSTPTFSLTGLSCGESCGEEEGGGGGDDEMMQRDKVNRVERWVNRWPDMWKDVVGLYVYIC